MNSTDLGASQVAELVDRWGRAVAGAIDRYDRPGDPGDIEQVGLLLADAVRLAGMVADVRGFIETRLVRLMGPLPYARWVDVPGARLQRRPGPRPEVWDTDGLVRLLRRQVEELARDNQLGPDEAAAAALDVLTAVARPTWRTTALRDRGVDVDDYRTRGPAGSEQITVTLTGGQS